MAEYSCKRCGGEVAESASRCRHCGYDTASHNKYRWMWGLLGLPLMLSVIGIPIGLICAWKARKHRKALKSSVATKA